MSGFNHDRPDETKAEKPAAPKEMAPVMDREESVVAQIAYAKWENAGRPQGQWEKYWLEAESQVMTVRRRSGEARIDVPQ